MGSIRTEITLRNPLRPDVPSVVAQASFDPRIMTLCLPECIVRRLDLHESEKRKVAIADGTIESVSYVGPIQATFQNRGRFCGAMVMGDTVLLGAIAIEDMDLVISPKHQSIEVNPDSPNIAQAIVM
jgi:hypothetical protein